MAEVDELLEDESSPGPKLDISPLTDNDSPTVAVKAVIEARISEEMEEFGNSTSKTIATKTRNATTTSNTTASLPNPTTLPSLASLTRIAPLPLVIPPFDKAKHLAALRGTGARCVVNPDSGNDSTRVSNNSGMAVNSTNAKTGINYTKIPYADKAKAKAAPRELVSNILYVYSTKTKKAPLTRRQWDMVDEQLIGALIIRTPGARLIRISNSGYNAKHSCGFIACRDLFSANWVKWLVSGMLDCSGGVGYRAWAKDEKLEARTCRLFLPARFNRVHEDQVLLPVGAVQPAPAEEKFKTA